MALGPLVAIIGRPNVGKSSLFNRLAGRRQAITDASAGTTRDANYSTVEWSGRRFDLVDTAGLGTGEGELEPQIAEQIIQITNQAAILVLVVDATGMVTSEDLKAARLALRSGHTVILVLNKIDAAKRADLTQFNQLGIQSPVAVSAIQGQGTGELLDKISAALPSGDSAAIEDQLRIAILGRPNVGKSSLLNRLAGHDLALVAGMPGTTRDINSTTIKYHGSPIELLDTAGLRRRGRIMPGLEKFSALRTYKTINFADIGLLLIDAAEPLVKADQRIAGQIADAGKGLILTVNKWDLVDASDETAALLTSRLRHDFNFVSWAPLIFISAATGHNLPKILEQASAIAGRRRTQIPTPELNRLVERLTLQMPPAGKRRRQPKLNYVTQTGIAPPTFTFFGSYPELIHYSYKRYLENGLRAQYDFEGTPVVLEFRSKRAGE